MVVTLAAPRNSSSRGLTPASRENDCCPECGATAPVPTPEGFTVCSACGIEYPGSQPYVCSDAPARGGGILQSHMVMAPHTRRMLGTPGERATLSQALQWAEKCAVTYEQEVFTRAYFEARKVFAILDLDGRDSIFNAALAGFVKAYRATQKGSRCHNVHLLTLVATYRALRSARLPVTLKSFLASCLGAGHDALQFKAVLQDTAGAFPRAHPGEIIPREVSAIVSRLQIPRHIQVTAGEILKHHLGAFHSPKTAVRAAAIVSTAVIISGARARFTLSAIAQAAGIAASALIRCVTEACVACHHPLGGSITRAGDHLRATFLQEKPAPAVPTAQTAAPGKATITTLVSAIQNPLVTAVKAVARKAQMQPTTITAAVTIATTHKNAFTGRVLPARVGAILGAAAIATKERGPCHLGKIATLARANYQTMISYLKHACTSLGLPLAGKITRAGAPLRALFLDGKPLPVLSFPVGPPRVPATGPPQSPLLDGLPPEPILAPSPLARLALPRKCTVLA